jgi:hypothetical protein
MIEQADGIPATCSSPEVFMPQPALCDRERGFAVVQDFTPVRLIRRLRAVAEPASDDLAAQVEVVFSDGPKRV